MITYPRRCASCTRSYQNRSSFCNHRKKCNQYTAQNIIEKDLKQKTEDILSILPKTSSDSAFEIPVPDIVTRKEYLQECSIFYVLQTPHSFNCGLNVYKIGRTIDMTSRKSGYPKGSIVVQQLLCRDAAFFENHMKTLLTNSTQIRHRTDFGQEYFEGDLMIILKLVLEAYEKTGMSPSHVTSEPIDVDASSLTQELPDDLQTAILVEREYKKMKLEKKLLAVAAYKSDRNEELDEQLAALLSKIITTEAEDRPPASPPIIDA